MSKIIYNLVYNRKRSLNKKGMALVQVEAYLDRKKKYFSTKVYLKPEQWDNKKLIRHCQCSWHWYRGYLHFAHPDGEPDYWESGHR